MKVRLIAALTKEGVIGRGNSLPWHIADDLKRFKRLTEGQVVIMGKKTHESIGRPLPGRVNIVLSREGEEIDGVLVCGSLAEGLAEARKTGREVFIIGGASVYEQALPMVDVMYLSHIKGEYEGDVFFPRVDWREWRREGEEDFDEFKAVTYTRVRAEEKIV